MSTLDRPIWSKYSIALTCPARSHFQRTLSKDRWVQGWDERYRSSGEQEECWEEDGHEKRRRKEKTGDQLQRSCVLPFYGRSGGSKAKIGLRRVPGVSGTLGKATQPKPNGVGDRTTTLRFRSNCY